MKASFRIPQGFFRGGEIEPGTFHGDQPNLASSVGNSAEPRVVDPTFSEEAADIDRLLPGTEVSAGA